MGSPRHPSSWAANRDPPAFQRIGLRLERQRILRINRLTRILRAGRLLGVAHMTTESPLEFGVEIGHITNCRRYLGRALTNFNFFANSLCGCQDHFGRTTTGRIDSNERTPERGPVGGGKRIGCLSEKDTMEGVLKNEREKSERSFGTGPERYSKRGREGRSRLLDEVCELCGYERKYVIKVLGVRRSSNSLPDSEAGSQHNLPARRRANEERFGTNLGPPDPPVFWGGE